MFNLSAKYYDALNRALGKNYEDESQRVSAMLKHHGISSGACVLDAGCGTGAHLQYLRSEFVCEGLDLDRNMLAIASQRCPEVPLHQADLISFNLGKKFDAILCLFSTIGYVPNIMRLEQTMLTFARHLRPGGVLIVEPWITPDAWTDGTLSALFVDEPGLKVARMNVARRDGNVSIVHFHYMIGSPDGIRTFTEPHRLTLFTHDEYRNALTRARFSVEYDEQGLTGRGLYIGTL